jgi:mRNA interferase MazF
MLPMLRGEVWWVDFEPATGGEIKKTRPAVIVSNDAANVSLNRIQVVPLTSNTGRVYASESVVNIGGKPSKAMADQLTTAAKERFKGRLGVISMQEMKGLEQVIKIQLGLQL